MTGFSISFSKDTGYRIPDANSISISHEEIKSREVFNSTPAPMIKIINQRPAARICIRHPASGIRHPFRIAGT
jgi:hypothetical protein